MAENESTDPFNGLMARRLKPVRSKDVRNALVIHSPSNPAVNDGAMPEEDR
jgi:hypothetical protein